MRRSVIAVIVLSLCALAPAGQWLTPDWQGQEPRFGKVPLYWFEVTDTPLVYRTVIDVPAGVDRAVALLRTPSYAYVCVDGRQVFAFAPRAAEENRPAVPADPDLARAADLTDLLTPGRHVLTVSAPAAGFVLDGGLYSGDERVAPLATDGTWTVTKCSPTTIVEDLPIMTLTYAGEAFEDELIGQASKAFPIQAGDAWSADAAAIEEATQGGFAARAAQHLGDAIWRLELLAKKGIYVIDATPYYWGGSNRLDPQIVAQAAEALAQAQALQAQVKGTQNPTTTQRQAWTRQMAALNELAERLSRQAFDQDQAKALELAVRVVPVQFVQAPTPEQLRQAIESTVGHPLNHLNESRYDRLGWMPNPRFADSQLGAWGVRINPVTGPTEVTAPRRWLFATDPGDSGVRELRWTIGYNIEGQMDRMDVPKSWTEVDQYKDYAGLAWYRARIQVPDEWAGNEVVLRFRVGGDERLWINDEEVTNLARTENGFRVYTLPPKVVAYGGENFLALRIDGKGERRGLLSPVTASAPSLQGDAGRSTPTVGVLSTPLSPCVVLTPRSDTLQIHHGGQATLIRPDGTSTAGYDAATDGSLKGNFVLLWLAPANEAGVERPIELVFQANPKRIECREGMTVVTLAEPQQRVIAVRPWAKAMPAADQAQQVLEQAALWSRAALAVPVNYMTVTRVLQPGAPWQSLSVDNLPRGPVLGQTVIYDYLETRDAWGTEPLKLAPLPHLCSYAIDTQFRNLQIEQADAIEVFQDGGLAAPYRGIRGDRVSYQYDVEPWPRLVGFTSWMFSYADAGVPGNEREMELIAAIGANSYRPQHNWSDQRPGRYNQQGRWEGYFPESDTRTRAQITADYCNAVGINYMNNIEQTLDRHQLCRENYDEWVRTVLFPHFDRLVPTLADRPFWAVAWDLVNEPFDHKAVKYNPTMKELTRRLREVDKAHLCYIEPCQAWGAIQQLRLIEPTGDPLTMYSFHDYNFRLGGENRWPTMEQDVTNICQMWWPAFEFAVKYGYGMHCGEFGGFYEPSNDSLGQKTLMNDLFRVFDQFGMHSNYYPGRGIYERLADGSMRPTNVVHVYREFFRRPDFNSYYGRWEGQPAPPPARP